MKPDFDPQPTGLAGCWRIRLPLHPDIRGHFVKSFHAPAFAGLGLTHDFAEDFFTVSHRGVLRGFHVVAPPLHGSKLVYTIDGQVLDAVIDLRPGSATLHEVRSFELDATRGDALLVPAGVAHAFLVTSERAIVGYKTEHVHEPSTDLGVHWRSTAMCWPIERPLVSARDELLPPLPLFANPFG